METFKFLLDVIVTIKLTYHDDFFGIMNKGKTPYNVGST